MSSCLVKGRVHCFRKCQWLFFTAKDQGLLILDKKENKTNEGLGINLKLTLHNLPYGTYGRDQQCD